MGIYKLVMEAGWGISIGIYDEAKPGWKSGVVVMSKASRQCGANWCGIKVRLFATIPSDLSHRAEALSAAHFCSAVASAQQAMAAHRTHGSIQVPNEADVTVLTADVHAHAESPNWVDVIVAGVLGALLVLFLCAIIGLACGGGR